MKFARFLSLALVALGLSACTPDSNSPSSPGDANPATNTSQAAPEPDSASARKAIDLESLAKYHWQLVSAKDADGKRIDALFGNAAKPLQLDFDDTQLKISNLCNHMGGQFRIEGDMLIVSQLTHTMLACADKDLMAMEGKAAALFDDEFQVRLNLAGQNPQLTLVTAAGTSLTLHGVPTAETRYGSEGETVFLEVAAKTQPCNESEKPATACLEVRERHYDSNGVETEDPGAWRVLAQPIEGYQHEAGTGNVLRVKRYAVADAPAGASSTVYVLDLVVESEVVEPQTRSD